MTLKRAAALALIAATLATAMHFLRPRTLIIETAAEEPPKDQFPFSSRPNRAREIHWKKWSAETFAEAKKAGKPVAVALTATWCQKCHEMDEGAFSDEKVIAFLNEKFICIRVDTDRMPDVKDRYLSSKGWPTTAFCTPDGEVISKTWIVPAEEFLALATKAADAFAKNPKGIEYRPPTPGPAVAAAPEEVDAILAAIEKTWADDGTAWAAPGDLRFPSPQIIELYLRKASDSGEERWRDRATLGLMATRKIYDSVEGGFYRVAMKPDWSEPHFEKILELNAAMLRSEVQVALAWGDGVAHSSANLRSANQLDSFARWFKSTISLTGGGWASSQDADEEYFRLDAEGRAKRTKPRTDETFYSGPNALTASAFFLLNSSGRLHKGGPESEECRLARKALDRVFEDCWSTEGLAHCPGGTRDVLHDLALVGEACLDAHQAVGEWNWVKRAEDVAARIEKLADKDGAFFDRPPDPNAPGHLRFPLKKSADNGRAAGFLVRLHHVTGVEKWKTMAESALKAVGGEAKQYPAYSAEYALAVMKLRRYPLHLVIVGPKAELPPMVAAADRFWHPWKTVTVLESNGAEVKHAGLEYPPDLAVYACVAEACGPPIKDPAAFDDEIKAFLERNK